MKLHKGDLYWDITKKESPYLNLTEDTQVDVLVIGGGMSGALISYELKKAGIDVMVVDKKIPGYGSSWGNTGIIQYCSDMAIDEMAKEHNEKLAVDFYNLCLDAMTNLNRIVDELDDEVGYKATSSLYIASKSDDIPKMKENYAMLKKYNFPAEWISEKTLKNKYHLNSSGAILTSNDAELNPFKMVQALHKDNLKKGVKVYSNCEIIEMSDKLLKGIKNYYPELEVKIEYRWQSVFGVSDDGLPFIGRDKINPNKYFALGFGGNGTCYSVAAAAIIKDFINGKTHPYAYTTKLPRNY